LEGKMGEGIKEKVAKIPKNDRKKIAQWIYDRGIEWIDNSNIRNLDRTAKIFVELLEELKSPLAEKLYKYYDGG